MYRGVRTVFIVLLVLVFIPWVVLSDGLGSLSSEPATVLVLIVVALFALAAAQRSRQLRIAGWTAVVVLGWVVVLAPGGILQPKLNTDRLDELRYGQPKAEVEEILGGPPGNYGRYRGGGYSVDVRSLRAGDETGTWHDDQDGVILGFVDDHVVYVSDRVGFWSGSGFADRMRRILEFRRIGSPRGYRTNNVPQPSPRPAATPGAKRLAISKDKPIAFTPLSDCDPKLEIFKHWSDTDRSFADGPGGLVWFVAGRWLGQFTPFGAGWAIPIGDADMSSAAAGPDGALWVTDMHSTTIRRFSFDGQMRTYPVPTREGMPALGGSFPTAMTRGPDGAMWFLETNADKLGRIMTDGKITEYDIPRGDTFHLHPEQMTLGPDNALWFTQRYRSAIGRFDPATKRFDSFDVPAHPKTGLGPLRIAGGTMGVWFTSETDSISKISKDGDIDSFKLPNGGIAGSIALGTDGNVWATDISRGKILAIGPDGTVERTFDAPRSNALRQRFPQEGRALAGMTTGPDGAMWISLPATGRTVRIGCPPQRP